MSKNLKTSILLFLFVLILSHLGHSAIIYKNEFPDTYNLGSSTLKLRGSGLKRYFGFKIWVSALYLQQDAHPSEALDDVPKKLYIQYLIKIPAVEIARATEIGIRNNIAEQEYQVLEEKIKLANSLWPNVKRGDRYEVSYVPGEGTSFVFNGQLQQIIKGDDFARAFFSIWVGDRPIDRRLKRQMLNLEDGR